MKRALLHPLLRVGVLVSLLSLTFCNKVNDYLRQWPDCEVQQYTYSLLSAYLPFLYQKRYDPSGKFVQEISVAFNGLQVLELQDLSLRSSQKKLLLVNSTNVADTTFSIEFNSIGRPLTILWTTRYDRLRLSFTYKNNRLKQFY